MKNGLICLLLFTFFSLKAQTLEELFAQAGSAYNREDWQTAIDNYQKILSQGQASEALYYNLANAHYKKGDIAPSIYYYEKALQLAPDNPQVQANLKYAQQMALDKIAPLPKMWSQRLVETLSQWNSPNGWGVWAVVSMCLFVIFFLWYYFSQKVLLKRIFFTLMLGFLFLSVGSYFLGNTVNRYVHRNLYGVLFDKEVRFFEEPNTYSKEAFLLHEGAKVEILDEVGDWYKLKIADGRTGWVKKHTLKTL
ncbi:SH3 domain-containing protein [Capnocytophaga sp. G2]|uniref:SH3 domain-containing protein n=1 Tax=Capnocytophaga sp. G2 TaxID=3110695 RepID=UPI002B48BCF2|nr:SH3 domain-containing protein [Capnocytophaga sp. G2]MEB3005130.1 SH3 domain-containing protein [Capnocytophaga sp. G2]